MLAPAKPLSWNPIKTTTNFPLWFWAPWITCSKAISAFLSQLFSDTFQTLNHTILPLTMQDFNYSWQTRSISWLWCPGSWCRQDISSHDTDHMKWRCFCLLWKQFWTTCDVLALNDITCKWMFMPNLACECYYASPLDLAFFSDISVTCTSWLTGIWLNLFQNAYKYVCIFYHFPTLRW